MDQIALGKRIKAARERAGMTQEELAAAVDYSVDHMSVVERGVKAPKLDKLVAIANVLKVGTDELLQDNLDAATLLHATELSERLKALSPEGQRKVMNVLLCYCSSKRTIPVLKSNRSDTMKKKKINADAALLEVARRHHTTVEEVRKEIRLAMIAAMCNPDPAVQKRWREIPHTGDTITPEDLITYIAKQCLPQ